MIVLPHSGPIRLLPRDGRSRGGIARSWRWGRAALVAVGWALSLRALVSAGEITPAAPVAGVGPTSEVRKVAGDLNFTEGPACDRQGRLYFTDVPKSRILRLEDDGTLAEFLAPSGRANGTMWNGAGELVACQMEGRVVVISSAGELLRTLTESPPGGGRYNAPNDLVVDRTGGVYFSDPRLPVRNEPDNSAVYWASADGATVRRLVEGLKMPNGVILSPDESTLYIVPTFQPEIMAYPVTAPGELGPGRVFALIEQPPGKSGTGGDGLTLDEAGRLYVATNLGIQIFSPAGENLGYLRFPEQPSNATFGGPDGKTLYVTARKSVYAVALGTRGHVFPGGGVK